MAPTVNFRLTLPQAAPPMVVITAAKQAVKIVSILTARFAHGFQFDSNPASQRTSMSSCDLQGSPISGNGQPRPVVGNSSSQSDFA